MSRPPIRARQRAAPNPSRDFAAEAADEGIRPGRTQSEVRRSRAVMAERSSPAPGEAADYQINPAQQQGGYVSVSGGVTMGMPNYGSIRADVTMGQWCEPTDEARQAMADHLSGQVGERLREELGRMHQILDTGPDEPF